MKRRDLLAATLTTASGIGLAGCNGLLEEDTDDTADGDGGGTTSCATPDSNLADSHPSGGSYERQGDVTTGDGEDQPDVEASAAALYTGPDDESYIFSITEYSSPSAAKEQVREATSEGNDVDEAVGYIQTGAYIFVGTGPDEASITALLKASPTLSDGCVEDNIAFLGGQDDSTPSTPAPSAAFAFDYLPSTRTLTITFDSGDQIRASNLYVRGDFDGGDRSGNWQLDHGGSASSEIDGAPAVAAGDSVTVDAGSSYEIAVVWESDSNSATLATQSGPDA